jgi:hypothetical protein
MHMLNNLIICSGLVLPDFEECQKCTESGLTTQQWADLRVEGLQRPEVQQRLYRYRVQRLSRGSTGIGWRDSRGQRFSRGSTGTGWRDSKGQRFSRGSLQVQGQGTPKV